MANGTDQNTQPTGHQALITWFAGKAGLDQASAEKEIMGSAKTFEDALYTGFKEVYEPNNPGLDYQTFRSQYLKDKGNPFSTHDLKQQTGGAITTTANEQLNIDQPEPGPGEAPSPSPDAPDFSNIPIFQPPVVYDDLPPEGHTNQSKVYQDLMERKVASDAVHSRRNGDWTTPGDEIGINNDENPDYVRARFKYRTPMEMISGIKDPALREYTDRLQFLQDDQNNLSLASEDMLAIAKEQTGIDIDNLTEITPEQQQILSANPAFNDYFNMLKAMEVNVERFKELTTDAKYDDVREMLESSEEGADIADRDGVYWEEYPRQMLMRSLLKVPQALGAIWDAGEQLITGDDTYNWADGAQEWMMDIPKMYDAMAHLPSSIHRPFISSTTDLNKGGKRYQIDFDNLGEIQSVRDSNGRVVDLELSDEEIANVKKQKRRNQKNWGAFTYQAGQATTDLVVQVAASGGIAGALGKAGMKKSLAAQVGTTLGISGQMMGPLYTQALSEGMESDEAAKYAFMTSGLIGLSGNLFGMESKLIGGPKGFLDDLFKARRLNAAQVARGGATTIEKAAASAGAILKGALGESFEETIVETGIDRSVRAILSQPIDDLDYRELVSTAAVSFAVGALGTLPSANTDPYKANLHIAVTNPAMYEKQLRALAKFDLIDLGVPKDAANKKDLKDEQLQREVNRIVQLSDELDVLRSDIPADVNEEDVLYILDRRRELRLKAEKAKAISIEGYGEAIEQQLRGIDNRLSAIMGVDPAKRKVAAQGEGEVEVVKDPVTMFEKYKPNPNPPSSIEEDAEPTTEEVVNHRGVYKGKKGYVRYDPEQDQMVFQPDNGDAKPIPSGEPISSINLSVDPAPRSVTYVSDEEIYIETRPDTPLQLVGFDYNQDGDIVGVQMKEPGGQPVEVDDPILANEIYDKQQGREIDQYPAPPSQPDPTLTPPPPEGPTDVAGEMEEEPDVPRVPTSSPGDTPVIDRTDSQSSIANRIATGELNDAGVRDLINVARASGDPSLMDFANTVEERINTLEASRNMGPTDEEIDAAIQAQRDMLMEDLKEYSLYDEAELEARSQENQPQPVEPTDDLSSGQEKFLTSLRSIYSGNGSSRFELIGARDMCISAVNDVDKVLDSFRTDLENNAEDSDSETYRETERLISQYENYRGKLLQMRDDFNKKLERLESGKAESESELDERAAGFLFVGGGIIEKGGDLIFTMVSSVGNLLAVGDVMLTWAQRSLAPYIDKYGIAIPFVHTRRVNRGQRLIGDLNNVRIAYVNSQVQTANILNKQLVSAATAAGKARNGEFDPQAILDYNEALKNPEIRMGEGRYTDGSPIEDGVMEVLCLMRQNIDTLSQTMIDLGLMDGHVDGFLDRHGEVYVHRSYQIHNDKKWVGKVVQDPDVWDPGVVWYKGELESNLNDQNKKKDNLEKIIARQEARLTQLNSVESPHTYRRVERRLATHKESLEATNKLIGEIEADLKNVPVALEAMLQKASDEKFRPSGVAKSGRLGTKNLGILKTRGGEGKAKKLKSLNNDLDNNRVRIEEIEQSLRDAIPSRKAKIAKDLDKLLDKQRKLEEQIATAKEEEIKGLEKKLARLNDRISDKAELLLQDDVLTDLQKEKLLDSIDELDALLSAQSDILSDIHEVQNIDIPPELRALYGEYQDALVNFTQTISKQAHLIANRNFLEQLKLTGLDSGVFTTTRTPQTPVKIEGEGGDTYNPVAGLYCNEATNNFLKSYNESSQNAPWLQLMLTGISTAKKAKTILSPITHVRNILSSAWFHLMQGDPIGVLVGPLGEMIGAVKALERAVGKPGMVTESSIWGNPASDVNTSAAGWIVGAIKQRQIARARAAKASFDSSIYGKGSKLDLDRFQRYVELGLTDESNTYGDTKSLLDAYHKKMQNPEGLLESFQQHKMNPMGKMKAGADWATSVYQSSDSYHRIYAYERELAREAWVLGIPYGELADPNTDNASYRDIQMKVAQRARNLYPTYSEIPRLVQQISRIPFIAPFASFMSETVRVMYNSGKIILDDMQSGDPKRKVIAGIRLGGMVGSYIALQTVLNQLGAAGDDDERDKWRHLLPDWSRNSSFLITGVEGEKFNYIDLGPIVPQSAMFSFIGSTLSGNIPQAQRYLGEIAVPFIANDIMTTAAVEVGYNFRSGRPGMTVYNEDDPLWVKALDITGHLGQALLPGAVPQFNRIMIASGVKQPSSAAQNYEMDRELMAMLTGVRQTPSTMDFALGIRMRKYKSGYENALATYRRPAAGLADQNVGIVQRKKRLSSQWNRARQQAITNVAESQKIYLDLKSIGLTNKTAEENFKFYRKDMRNAIFRGMDPEKIVDLYFMPNLDNK